MIADVAVGLPRNDELAGQLDLLADLMEVQAGDSFRIGAYRKAAARIRETSASVAQLALQGRAKELQGIGKTIESKIVEVPISFVDREHGHSKMNRSIVLEAVWKVPLLRVRALTRRL